MTQQRPERPKAAERELRRPGASSTSASSTQSLLTPRFVLVVSSGLRTDHEVEPLSNCLVSGVKKDLRGGDLVVGAIGTSVLRESGDSTVQARLRSNKAYTLSAQAAALNVSSPAAADGGTSITLGDIGFGVTAVDATGANVATGHTDTIVSLFNYSSGFPAVSNGLTPFAAGTNGTLSDLTSNTQVLSGSRISAKGNISTNNNFVLVTFGVATLPQYFTPNSGFSTTVTLTIAAP